MAKRDHVKPDIVAGVPDSGTAHAVGYANESGVPFSRPFIKYTPTWPRSFMPTVQSKRDMIAKMKMLAVHDLIQDRRVFLDIDGKTQEDRIRNRNGEDRLQDFLQLWIPLEEAYFQAFSVWEKADYIIL